MELRGYLSGFAARCKAAGWLGALFHAGIAQDIAADAIADREKIAREAHAAEVEDLEAAKLIDTALSDGLQPEDEGVFRLAIRHIRRSAGRDHFISDWR